MYFDRSKWGRCVIKVNHSHSHILYHPIVSLVIFVLGLISLLVILLSVDMVLVQKNDDCNSLINHSIKADKCAIYQKLALQITEQNKERLRLIYSNLPDYSKGALNKIIR